ncbi:MAG: hypothetical protein AB9919_09655 [Geobacteraceae bacterium]
MSNTLALPSESDTPEWEDLPDNPCRFSVGVVIFEFIELSGAC